jgi:hypothetical protein
MQALLCNPFEIIIEGVTLTGEVFRPSDWSERLSGILSVFGEDNRMSYSPYLRPMMVAGVRCVAVDRKLETLDPRVFAFLFAFAHDNNLRVMDCKKFMDANPKITVLKDAIAQDTQSF